MICLTHLSTFTCLVYIFLCGKNKDDDEETLVLEMLVSAGTFIQLDKFFMETNKTAVERMRRDIIKGK